MLDVKTATRLVIYGGSFDPPHVAHAQLPVRVAAAIGADGVLYIPAGTPPHKQRRLTAAHHRLEMLRLALADEPNVAIDTWELEEPGYSYTYKTLEHLRATLGDAVDLRLLMGTDMAATFYQWVKPERILELCRPLVMMRPPSDPASLLESLPADLGPAQRQMWAESIVGIELIDVSSTQLRDLLRARQYDSPLVKDMLHPAVLEYIREQGLYAGR